MNIKSLLIGSAAALAAVSGAQAADAIVAAEPEPMEYVRVCDAFGTGFFYIPGTETCLKFDGYVRFQTDFGRDKSGRSDWDTFTRAQFNIDTRTDTELGALRGYIGFQGNADRGANSVSSTDGSSVFVDQAFIELAGIKVGKFTSWWDDGLSGETDVLSTNAKFNSARYIYDAGSFWAGVSGDELEGTRTQFGRLTGGTVTSGITGKVYSVRARESDNNFGIAGGLGAKFGAATLQLIGGYDTKLEEGALRLIATADIGPGKLGLAGVWASGANAYYAESEWAVAAEYAIAASEKLTITPSIQYSGNMARTGTALTGYSTDVSGGDLTESYKVTNSWGNVDEWRAGVTVDYKITDGFSAKVGATYVDRDFVAEQWTGLVRLQRGF
ncbi:porin [Agrobacterium tumefaciens]|uniref:porin n=1 Tax=Agrobacterium tumefaciens TaxID=358 RepID=UPI0015730A51|nr:porin [Agrobacterium tumefaciens]NSZ86924.1 porin [Agrobacterium tumefaciens]WCA72103.1 porin [Agrobacterium tumefaciens]